MSEGDHPPDDIPASLVPILARMGARIELLRDIVLFLCAPLSPGASCSFTLRGSKYPLIGLSRKP